KETYRVECSIVAGQSDPSRVEAANWAEQYGKCLDVVRRYRKEVGGSAGADVQRWLTRWLDKNPLHYFCFLKDWLCGKSAEAWTENLAVEALFWIVQDCRNAFLHCGCFECQEDLGVPIARVWVKLAAGTGGKSKCQVLTIDTQPPYRRAIHGSCWPAPLGQVNLGQVIWRRADDGAATLGRLGVRLGAPLEFKLPDTAEALEHALDGGLLVPSDRVNQLLIFDSGSLGFRIVGIGQ